MRQSDDAALYAFVTMVDAPLYDLAIIGGGINGMGLARDAAGRGLSVFLCEARDFGGATSSASTKLVHGGLRYLEQYQFRLVREALAEREVLMRIAPHLVAPMRFVLPHHEGLRPQWILRLGLFIYDHLARVGLPHARGLDLRADPAGAPLNPRYVRGFEYSDCTVDDARLVILNAVDARARGAVLMRDTLCAAAERSGGIWRLMLRRGGDILHISARVLVNAAGPWVGEVADRVSRLPARGHLRLDKGSHIVVPKLFDHDRAYIFQNKDRRVVFAIPYRKDFTLIGTTEEDYKGDPGKAVIDAGEIEYLCATISEYFRVPLTRDRIVWTYSGVRPLYAEPGKRTQDVSRDYVFELDSDGAPLLTVYGGKLTTYRKLAEAALARLTPHLAMGPEWTAGAVLPGGDLESAERYAVRLRADYPFLAPEPAERLVRAYGTRAKTILGSARGLDDLGQDFGAGLTEAEIRYLIATEWAESAEDILWRRSKLGLQLGPDRIETITAFVTRVTQQIHAEAGA